MSDPLPPVSEVRVSESVDANELVKIITELVAEKPKSITEALKIIGELQEKITDWVLSDVPDKDKVIAGLKAAEVIAKSVGCLPCFPK
jgi:hypothetical protein